MTEREKVIEILEKAKTIIENWVPMFEQYNTPAGIDCAIELLKEQEAVEPTWSRGKPFCGACGLRIRGGGKFCGECGKLILWEGRRSE